MHIDKVEAKNLFSVGHIELDLRNRGLLLVDGYSQDDGCSNGSGKSTVANKIILWTLFGKTAGGIRADKVVNRNRPDENAWGRVVFHGRRETSVMLPYMYEVLRTRNPSALKLIKAGVDISARHERDTQELINQTLGRDFNTFLHTDFFGQGRKDNFLELTPKEQAELLEEILPIDQLDEWATTAKESKEAWDRKFHMAEGEIISFKGQLQEARYTMGLMSKNSALWHITTERKREQIANQLAMVTPIDDLLAKRDVLIAKSVGIGDGTLEAAQKGITQLRKDKEEWLAVAVRTEAQPVDDTCNTCKQTLPPEQREALIKTYTEMTKAHEDAKLNVGHCDQWINRFEDILATSQYKAELEKLEAEIEGTDIGILNKQLEDLANEFDPYDKIVVSTAARIEDLKGDLTDVEEDKSKIQRQLDRYAFWAKSFSKDFKALLFQKACPFLQARTKAHLEGLGNPQLQVTFSTAKLLQSGELRDEFNISVESDNGGASYDTLSGGEQQMVSFAVGLSLADLAAAQAGGPCGFMILDEPFVSLSERNCENIVRYLQDTLSKVKRTILLISNEPHLKMLIPERIFVVKENGVTSIGE